MFNFSTLAGNVKETLSPRNVAQVFGVLKVGISETISPKRNWQELRSLAKRETGLMTVMLIAQALAFIFGKDYSLSGILSLFTGVTTIINLILVDRGLLTNYLWGFIGSALWLIVAIHNRLIGDVTSQTYYVVMQFIGIYVWFNSMNSSETKSVKGKDLTPSGATLLVITTIIAYALSVALAKSLNGNLVYLDASLVPLAIIGQALMTYGFKSQWIIWILLDVINIIIWSIRFHDGGTGALSMLVLQIMMLINAIYGTYVWYRQNAN